MPHDGRRRVGVDEEELFQNRSALDMYEDFMASFAANFSSYMSDVIVEAQVGMGPAGELQSPGRLSYLRHVRYS